VTRPQTPPLASQSIEVDARPHCRVEVGDGTLGSGSLIDAKDSAGLILTCAHLFDGAIQQIVVTFRDGRRFAAMLVDRDRAHDLALLEITSPHVAPIAVNDDEPSGRLTACGFGPTGQFRCVSGNVVGHATAAGATYPCLTMGGAVRPGDSGGGVLNVAGQLVGVIWGQRDGQTYATCGRPLREFLNRVRGKYSRGGAQQEHPLPPGEGRVRVNSPQIDWPAWSQQIEQQLQTLDAKKQDKGHYLQAGDLNGYLRLEDAPQIDTDKFAQRTEVESRLKTLVTRFELVRAHAESMREYVAEVAAAKGGFFQGLSLGKVVAGALGLSGPLAIAVVIAGGMAGRRVKKHLSAGGHAESIRQRPAAATHAAGPIVVDSPIPPQRTVPETHYVPIEKDSFAKAHQWASEHVARKYPGAAEILQALESLIKQYLAGK
jgi:hypothetical protein